MISGVLETVIAVLPAFVIISAHFIFFPGASDKRIPRLVRAALITSLVILTLPALGTISQQVDGSTIFNSIVIGVFVGLSLRAVYYALLISGMMIAQLTSLSHLFGISEPSSAVGNLLSLSGLALLFLSGLHYIYLDLLLDADFDATLSYGRSAGGIAEASTRLFSNVFIFSFVLSAPFSLISIIYNTCLGVLNKAMPQLMVAIVGAPAITWGTIFLLFLATPSIILTWRSFFLDTYQAILRF
jgi:flagellar biosynthetic protein FliR